MNQPVDDRAAAREARPDLGRVNATSRRNVKGSLMGAGRIASGRPG